MFYDRFKMFCDEKGISCHKATLEIGLSNATATHWKNKGQTPKGETLLKIADYFGITVAELLGEEKEKTATNGDDLSAEELDFIRLYSKADEHKKAAIRILLGM